MFKKRKEKSARTKIVKNKGLKIKNSKRRNVKSKTVDTKTYVKNTRLDTVDDVDTKFNIQTDPEQFDTKLELENEAEEIKKLVSQQNRKKRKSGGFQVMGLSNAVYKGLIKKGYKMPTPIQRKCIPLIMENHDVVAMARTGSGKTAAFLIPMFQRLKARNTSGARALLLSPTRELAMQTLQFTKELGKYLDLKVALILGGEKMENQFATFHSNPDVIIATPGRLLHVLVEMGTKLNQVEYVVFDEADRLFERGFEEQLKEILCRLAEHRQTLLFSATLPKQLVEFAKAGLNEPQLVRLDLDTKLSENLSLVYLSCRNDDRASILLHLLQQVISPQESTVVFAATKHHVEYLYQLLQVAGVECSVAYSDLDAVARKINVAKFRSGKVPVMIVTDIAARGIDIPVLDNVINYHFPAKSKLFVHRVGRVARAGKSGTAYSLVAGEELACLIDLHLFLARPIQVAAAANGNSGSDGMFGCVPHAAIEQEQQTILAHLAANFDLANQLQVATNAYKQYMKCRPAPSAESEKRVKGMRGIVEPGNHPLFAQYADTNATLLKDIGKYKPTSTVFEMHSTVKTEAFSVMKSKRLRDEGKIAWHKKKCDERRESGLLSGKSPFLERAEKVYDGGGVSVQQCHSDYFIPYKAQDSYTEKGLAVDKVKAFEVDMKKATLDLTADDMTETRQARNKQLQWDRKKKKFTHAGSSSERMGKKIKTESGKWIPATYKSDHYNRWLKHRNVGDGDADATEQFNVGRRRKQQRATAAGQKPTGKNELKTAEQIYKQRKKKQQVKSFQRKRQKVRANKRA